MWDLDTKKLKKKYVQTLYYDQRWPNTIREYSNTQILKSIQHYKFRILDRYPKKCKDFAYIFLFKDPHVFKDSVSIINLFFEMLSTNSYSITKYDICRNVKKVCVS